ncbi:ABC transporter, membrane protein [Geotalea daltonii FRC-32]|uniref:ABC transporter, membrane protein n=1 Tax=Geotalea daltonii (strain DSM 22248 / JCM 15807 / FRC-32) TaxID=316067 RepID=B9LYZ7_GEODF|nr:ABC transporter permease [Geotalea daltonii]ACM18729.1 ABC transporter, membrane protein [Geotalea daltonii FRC-32]
MNGFISKLARLALPLTSLIAFTLLWQVAARRYPPEQFPAPSDVVRAIVELADMGTLWSHMGISLARFGAAYLLAVLAGIPLGLFLGRFIRCHKAIDPLIQVLRPISPIAWFPLAVLWFGIGNAPAVFIIFLASFYPVLLATISAVRAVPPVYLKVAGNFGARADMTFLRVIVPAAFPGIMVGLHIAVGTGWIHLVAGEMLGAQSGLGFMIVDARNFLRTDQIMAGMLLVGLLGLAIYRGMKSLERIIGRRWGVSQ